MIFHDLMQISDIPPAHSISNANIIMKNFKISSEHNNAKNNHAKNNHAMKSIEEIVKNVSKSYHKHAHLLMKHLFRKVVPDRINWDKHGIVTIDGNVVKNSNITLNKRFSAREKNC